MVKAGLVQGKDERVKTLLDEAKPLEERRLAADTLVCERYGETYFDSYSVEETELPLEQRTTEQQAEFDQWSAVFWAKWDARGKQPLTVGRVYRESINNLTEVGDFPRSLLRCVQVSYEWSEKKSANIVTVSIDKALYLSTKTAEQSSCFDAECGFGKGDLLCYQFLLDEYGEFLEFCDAEKP